ncbi:MAG: SRPBCC family protein [Actinomycetota bacterium]|nr:SRPBCC family protein [Actinomycetota bacterium]
MGRIEKDIEVEAPLSTVYNQWTQFEEFPRFMEGVERVEQVDDTTLRWEASIAGQRREWTADIIEQVPDKRIAWMATQGETQNGGVVTFEPVDDSRTRIMLEVQYEPDDFFEQIGDKLGLVSARVKGDLDRFKEFIEGRGQETGAWRGEVHGGQKTTSGQSGITEPTGTTEPTL